MKKIITHIVYLCITFLLTVSHGNAAEKSVLVLYKSSENNTAEQNIFAYHLQAFAEEKGYTIHYHDIESSFPSNEMMSSISAITTIYNGPIMKNAREYIDWLSAQILRKKKVIIIGNFGAYSPDGEIWFDGSVLNPFYNLLGLEFAGNWTDDPQHIQVNLKDPEMVEFEAKLTPETLTHYFTIKSLRPENDIFLSLSRNDLENSDSAVIVKTPVGGLALENYIFRQINGEPKKLLHLEKFFDTCVKDPIPEGVVPEKRILALYKTTEDATPDQSFIARFLAKDLILLGYWPEYAPVDNGAPDNIDMTRYHAVITWFRTPFMYRAEEYCDWLLTQIRKRRKVIIFGNFGAFGGWYRRENVEVQWIVSNTKLNHFLYNFGLEFRGSWTGDPSILVPQKTVSEMVEQDLAFAPEDFRHYQHWRSVYPENEIYLQVGRTDQPEAHSAFIVRTPFGGFAFEGYIYKSDPETWDISFYVNRSKFLKACLEYQADRRVEPIPLVSHESIFAELLTELKKDSPPLTRQNTLTPEPDEVKRKILALYKRSEQEDFSEGFINNFAEPVLNHLGFFLDYHTVEDGLPGDDVMQQYHGILTWFTTPEIGEPAAYIDWLEHQLAEQRKLVILGDFGAWTDQESHIPYRQAYRIFPKMGTKVYQTYLSHEAKQQLLYADPDMLNYEYPLDLNDTGDMEYKITSINPENNVIIRVKDTNLGIIEPVIITPSGALALGDYVLHGTDPVKDLRNKIRQMLAGQRDISLDEANYLYYWRIDPFQFFKEAFGITDIPAPDVTTLNGYRIFYSHIDGDGFKGYSLIDQSNYSGYWVMREIFERYTLPITASVISREIEEEPSLYYNRPYMLAKEIFALESIEPASHTYTHPFKWRKGDLKIESIDETYQIERKPVDYIFETEGSMRFIEKNLLPKDKKTEILLWSGDCHPDSKALSILEHYNRFNMNAGDPIFDERRNSRTNLSTIGNSYSGYRQIHTSGMNDYLYTNGWTQDFDGMKNLVSHFEHTESPQRLSALNIYYHFYIGDRQLGLDGLRQAYDYCVNQKIAPMFTSQYIQIAQAYYRTRIFKNNADSWKITDNGQLRTIRFDNESRFPDFSESTGIIGFGHVNNDLYIYLDNTPNHIIALTDAMQTHVYLAWGSHYVENLSISPAAISFESRGYGQAEFVLANLPAGSRYIVTIIPKDTPAVRREITADASGMLTVNHSFLAYHGRYRIRIEPQG